MFGRRIRARWSDLDKSDAPMNELLQFEQDKCRDPRRFPMHFRLKLDLCGIKLSKRDWHRFDPADKVKLLGMPCETAAQIASFREKLLAMIGACEGDSLQIAPQSASHAGQLPWTDTKRIPEAVRRQVQSLAHEAVDLARWPQLSDLQRFALIKLTAPGQVKPELRQVLKEFSLMPPDKHPV